MVNAVANVQERMLRATAVLAAANIPYAVAGGNAVAIWVTRVDESAVRNTKDVDILLRLGDLERAKAALEAAGFIYRRAECIDVFLDGPMGKARDGVHIIFANEKVRPHEALPSPDVDDSEPAEQVRVLSLDALVRIKLTAFRDKDRVHLRDLIEMELIDASWKPAFPQNSQRAFSH